MKIVSIEYTSMFGTKQTLIGELIYEDKHEITIRYIKKKYTCTMPKKDILKMEVIGGK